MRSLTLSCIVAWWSRCARAYKRRVQQAQLDHVVSSRAASTVLAENYVGLESG
jgi:hypothetical protein